MSISLGNQYGTRANPPDADYPEGTFKDETAPGADNGTPVQEAWARDKDGAFQGILKRSGQVANGDEDTVLASQYLNGLDALKANTPAPPQATPADICAGMPTVDRSDPNASPNYLATGQTIRDSCIGWEKSEGRHFIFIMYGTVSVSRIEGCWDYSGAPVMSVPYAFTWGTTPDYVCAICCDGDYLYVAWSTTAGNMHISKFAMNPFTGVELWARDLGVSWISDNQNVCKLCVADTDTIGISLKTAVSQLTIGTVKKDNSDWSLDVFTAYSIDATSARVISDGTYLYAIGYQGTRTYYLCRADIADTSTQDITQIAVTSGAWNKQITALERVRDVIVMANSDGEIFAYDGTTDDQIATMDDFPDYNLSEYGVILGSDGRDLHFHAFENYQFGSGTRVVFPIPISGISMYMRRSTPLTLYTDRVRLNYTDIPPSTAPAGRLLCDRVDMWLVTYSGHVHRICAR